MSTLPATSHDSVLSAISELSLQIAEVKSQIQEIERDCSLMSAALEKAKTSVASVGTALDEIRVSAETQFAELSASKSAEDDLRDAVTSSFSDMFQAITKVFSTAQKLGIAPTPYPESSPASVETPKEETPNETVSEPEVETQAPETPELTDELPVEAPDVETSEETPNETISEPEVETQAIDAQKLPDIPDLTDIPELDPTSDVATELPEMPPLPQITAVEELPADPGSLADLSMSSDVDESIHVNDDEDDEDDDEYEDIEGDPEAVADLMKNFSSSFSTDLPPSDDLDAVAADLEKLLDGQSEDEGDGTEETGA